MIEDKKLLEIYKEGLTDALNGLQNTPYDTLLEQRAYDIGKLDARDWTAKVVHDYQTELSILDRIKKVPKITQEMYDFGVRTLKEVKELEEKEKEEPEGLWRCGPPQILPDPLIEDSVFLIVKFKEKDGIVLCDIHSKEKIKSKELKKIFKKCYKHFK